MHCGESAVTGQRCCPVGSTRLSKNSNGSKKKRVGVFVLGQTMTRSDVFCRSLMLCESIFHLPGVSSHSAAFGSVGIKKPSAFRR